MGSVSGPAPSSSTRGGSACARPKTFAPGSSTSSQFAFRRVACSSNAISTGLSGGSGGTEEGARGRMMSPAVRPDVPAFNDDADRGRAMRM